MLKLGIYTMVSLPVGLLSYIIPKKEKLLLFGSTRGESYGGNPKYLHKYADSNGLEAVYVTKSDKIKAEISAKGYNVNRGFWVNIWLLLRAEHIFIEATVYDASYFYILLGRFSIIQLWHGVPLKKIENDAAKTDRVYAFLNSIMNPRYSLIPANDPETAKNFESAFGNKNVKVTGYPRNDILFEDRDGYPELSDKYNLRKYKKNILYAPTFRDNTEFKPFTEEFLKELDKQFAESEYLLLVKEHPNKTEVILPDGVTNILQISKEKVDIMELLLWSDVLITDYSSTCFDFALTGRPMMFYCFDYEEYLSKNRAMYYDYKSTMPGPFIESESDLLNAIFDEGGGEYFGFTERFNDYKDGNSSKRVFDSLL